MKTRIIAFFLVISISAIIFQGAHAEWIDIPLVNPGAETGDMTGWQLFEPSSMDPNNYKAIYDPENAHGGNYYFSPAHFDHYSYMGIYQIVDLSHYRSVLQNVDFSAFAYLNEGYHHRIGYDIETDSEYEYVFQSCLAIVFYDADDTFIWGPGDAQEDGIGWNYLSHDTSVYGGHHDPWGPIKNRIDHVEIELFFYYQDLGGNNVPHWTQIDEWRGWIGGEPIVRFDSAKLRIEIINYTKSDVDDDGDVDGRDLLNFSDLYANATFPDADLNGDGVVDPSDMGVFASTYGFAP